MCTLCGNPTLRHNASPSRRDFLRMTGGAALGLALSGSALFAAGEMPKPQNILTPDEAFKKLQAGNKRYVSGVMKRHDFATERGALAGGQNPFAGILSCADSRVAPEYAFDTGRGDLFVVRVAGNFLNEDVIASFEYTVKFLGTPLLAVLGHEKCGAVDAAIKVFKDGAVLPGHLPELVEKMKPAVMHALEEKGDLLANAVRENVRLTVEQLRQASPIIKEYVDAKKVRVIGGVYELNDGRIDWLT